MASLLAARAQPNAAPAHGRVRFTVLGWLIALEGAAMIATIAFQPRPLGAVLGCAMGAALIANLALARLRLRGLSAEWVLPRPIHADDEVALAAVLRAPNGSGPLRLAAADPDRGGYRVVATLAAADAAGARATWTARFPRRGAWTLPPLEARSDQPFGLAEAHRAVSPPAELIVLPAIGGLRRSLRNRLGEWLESAASGLDRGDDELSHLRPWRAGDPPRRVHWRASARHRELLVAERATPLDRTVAVVLDVDAAGRRLERLVIVAATLIDHLIHTGWRVTLHGAFAADRVAGDRQALLETLALVQTRPGDVLDHLPPNRAAIVLAGREVQPPAGSAPVFVLTLAQAEEVVRLPAERRGG